MSKKIKTKFESDAEDLRNFLMDLESKFVYLEKQNAILEGKLLNNNILLEVISTILIESKITNINAITNLYKKIDNDVKNRKNKNFKENVKKSYYNMLLNSDDFASS